MRFFFLYGQVKSRFQKSLFIFFQIFLTFRVDQTRSLRIMFYLQYFIFKRFKNYHKLGFFIDLEAVGYIWLSLFYVTHSVRRLCVMFIACCRLQNLRPSGLVLVSFQTTITLILFLFYNISLYYIQPSLTPCIIL